MDSVEQLYCEFRDSFPDISAKADRNYAKYWSEKPSIKGAYSWLQSLANALNAEMAREVSYSVHEPLFVFINKVLANCSEEVFKCIDVSFVENLFWQVSKTKAEPYWNPMPSRLKELYVGFHGTPPL